MPKRRQTLAETFHDHVRLAIMRGDEVTPATVIPPSRIRKNKRERKRWTDQFEKYRISPRAPYVLRKIDDEVLVGVVARWNLKSNRLVRDLNTLYGRHLSTEQAKNDGNSVLRSVHYHTNETAVVVKNSRHKQYFRAHGNLAFINHACILHANCVPYNIASPSNSMWKCISTRRPVVEGEELTVNYNNEEDPPYPCRQCTPTTLDEEIY